MSGVDPGLKSLISNASGESQKMQDESRELYKDGVEELTNPEPEPLPESDLALVSPPA